MLPVTFHNPGEIEISTLKYAVICARYQGRWILCRHKERSTWEIPGGHIEPGETALEAAKRELWEETGVRNVDIRPVCVYKVSRYGMLFFAEAHSMDTIPEGSEIAETQIFDRLPDNLTYPFIQPHLFEKVQGWLNTLSGAGELWDIYDGNRTLTGRTHVRGGELLPGEYHLVVHVWIQNSRGQFLMTRRSPNKGFPLLWETTGGSALAGDDSLTAALREAKEETGLTLRPENGRIVLQFTRTDDHTDVWLFDQDFDLEDVSLQEGETCGKRLSTPAEILKGLADDTIVPFQYAKKWMEELL